MSIIEEVYESKKSEISAKLFTLTSRHGLVAKVTNYGGIIVSMEVPDRNGGNADIALGKDSLDDYLEGNPYFGTITGRVAGRIGGGRFTLEGRNYILAQNDEPNCLHGGEKGFDKILWEASITGDGEKEKLQLTTVDPAGHNNFPGTVRCTVTYGWIEDNSFEITYKAKTDHTTPLNLTNHSYFNLAGHDSGDVLGHEVQIHSDAVATVVVSSQSPGCVPSPWSSSSVTSPLSKRIPPYWRTFSKAECSLPSIPASRPAHSWSAPHVF